MLAATAGLAVLAGGGALLWPDPGPPVAVLLAAAQPEPTPYAVPTSPATDPLPAVGTDGLVDVPRGSRSVPWTLIRLWDGGLAVQHVPHCSDVAVHAEESDAAVVVQVVAGRRSEDAGCLDGGRHVVRLDRPLGERRLLHAATDRELDPPAVAAVLLADLFDDAPPWPGEPFLQGDREVTRDEISLAAGPEHCGWQDAVYLGSSRLGAPRDERGGLWARDPDGVLTHAPEVRAGFRARAVLPPDARATGYRQGAVEVWTAPSDGAEFVYLVNSTDRADVERWVRGGGGCA